MREYSTIYYGALALNILKYAGLSPYSIKNGKIVTNLKDLIYFLSCAAFAIFISCQSILHLTHDADSLIIKYGSIVMVNMAILCALIYMLFAFVQRHKVWKILLQMHEVDLKVKSSLI